MGFIHIWMDSEKNRSKDNCIYVFIIGFEHKHHKSVYSIFNEINNLLIVFVLLGSNILIIIKSHPLIRQMIWVVLWAGKNSFVSEFLFRHNVAIAVNHR